MLVKFLKARTVQDGSGTSFVEGGVYDLPPDSAQRWIRRNIAVAVDTMPKDNPAEKLRVPSREEPKDENKGEPGAPPKPKAKPEAKETPDTPAMTEERDQASRPKPDALKRSDITKS